MIENSPFIVVFSQVKDYHCGTGDFRMDDLEGLADRFGLIISVLDDH